MIAKLGPWDNKLSCTFVRGLLEMLMTHLASVSLVLSLFVLYPQKLVLFLAVLVMITMVAMNMV